MFVFFSSSLITVVAPIATHVFMSLRRMTNDRDRVNDDNDDDDGGDDGKMYFCWAGTF